jgi:competence protein ComEA
MKWKQYGGYALFGLVGILMIIGWTRTPQEPIALPSWETEEEERTPTIQYIYVDIKGAVRMPGVYKVEQATRLFVVVNLAGGLTEDADPNAINLSRILGDQMVIYVPTIEEGYPNITDEIDDGTEGVININTASLEELQTLPGIGPSTAQKIIDYREENGPFENKEDIMNVSGIGESTYAEIESRIVV